MKRISGGQWRELRRFLVESSKEECGPRRNRDTVLEEESTHQSVSKVTEAVHRAFLCTMRVGIKYPDPGYSVLRIYYPPG